MTLLDAVQIARRFWMTIAACILLAVGAAAYYAAQQPRLFVVERRGLRLGGWGRPRSPRPRSAATSPVPRPPPTPRSPRAAWWPTGSSPGSASQESAAAVTGSIAYVVDPSSPRIQVFVTSTSPQRGQGHRQRRGRRAPPRSRRRSRAAVTSTSGVVRLVPVTNALLPGAPVLAQRHAPPAHRARCRARARVRRRHGAPATGHPDPAAPGHHRDDRHRAHRHHPSLARPQAAPALRGPPARARRRGPAPPAHQPDVRRPRHLAALGRRDEPAALRGQVDRVGAAGPGARGARREGRAHRRRPASADGRDPLRRRQRRRPHPGALGGGAPRRGAGAPPTPPACSCCPPGASRTTRARSSAPSGCATSSPSCRRTTSSSSTPHRRSRSPTR